MLTRSAFLMIVTFFALSAGVASAKVSPALETQGQNSDQVLQQLINQPQGNETCDIAQWGFDSTGKVAPGSTLVSKLDDACPIPAPSSNPFENVASL